MSVLEPKKIWWTADEIASAQLPGMPSTQRNVTRRAQEGRWREYPKLARRRSGRGGGWEYHWTLLPLAAKEQLLKAAANVPKQIAVPSEAWAEFDALPDKVKAKAKTRHAALQMADGLYRAGATRTEAVNAASKHFKISPRAVFDWQGWVFGVAPEDWLPYLVARHRFANRKSTKATCSPQFIDTLKSLYLRLEQPTFSQSYRDACKIADAHGWDYLSEKTAKRHLEEAVPRVSQVFMREGLTGLMRCYPAQQRDRTAMTALEGVNADCHKIDVFVRWPDGTINRPQIVGFQDIYSGKILSWRVDHDPNKVMVMAAFGELVETWGIPRHCLFDNGHEFANKWMTAGTPTRFRFKVREDDPLGVLPLLGIEVHWATPAHGQAKPIERAFRDLASDIAKDPRFAGAYVGNRPDAKPENYGSRAVAAEEFLKVVAEGIIEHNARKGRLTQTTLGRSFDDTFAESYEAHPVRKPTEEQRRLWLMGQHVARLRKDNGQLRLYGNYYHSDWMSQRPGEQVVARFDPEDLHSGVHIYSAEGGYLGFAECRQKVGFFDVLGAKEEARRKARIKRAEKALAEAHRPVSIETIAGQLDQLAPAPAEPLEAKVVSPEFGRKGPALPNARPTYEIPENAEAEAARDALILEWEQKSRAPAQPEERDVDRYRRACALIARAEAGETLGRAEATWIAGYIETSEYRNFRHMEEWFGEDGVG